MLINYNSIRKSSLHSNIVKLASIFAVNDLLVRFSELSDSELSNIDAIKEELKKYFSKTHNPELEKINRIVDIEEVLNNQIADKKLQLKSLNNQISNLRLQIEEISEENPQNPVLVELQEKLNSLKKESETLESELKDLRSRRNKDRKQWFDYNFSRFIEPVVIKMLIQELEPESAEKLNVLHKRIKERPYLIEKDKENKKLLEDSNISYDLLHKSIVKKIQKLLSSIESILLKLSEDLNSSQEIEPSKRNRIENLYRFFKTSKIIFENIYQDVVDNNLSTVINVYNSPTGDYEYKFLPDSKDVIKTRREKLDELIDEIDSELQRSLTSLKSIKKYIDTTSPNNPGIIGYTTITVNRELLDSKGNIDTSLLPSNFGTEWSISPIEAPVDVTGSTQEDIFDSSYLKLKIQNNENELHKLKLKLTKTESETEKSKILDQISRLEKEIDIDKSIVNEYSSPSYFEDDIYGNDHYMYIVKAFIPKDSIDWKRMETEYYSNSVYNEIFVKPNSDIYLLGLEKINLSDS
ncbi:MAG: hypothetical protein ABIK31_02785, partial [candidate division WOR-3 bacterium]